MFGNEIGNRALKDDAKSLGIDAPTHDIERVGPQFFARRLDPGRASVAGAQNNGRRTVAEQAGGDDIGLGQFIVAHRKRAEFERDQKHVRTGPRLRKARRDRQPRHAARAPQTENRHARHVATQAEFAGDARLQRRRRDAGRTYRDDGVDIAGREIGTRDGLARDVDKQRFRAFQESLCPLRPAAPLEIPFDGFDPIAMADAGIGKQARKRLELRVAISEEVVRSLKDLLLMELIWRNRGRQRNQRGRVVHIAVPAFGTPTYETARSCEYFVDCRHRTAFGIHYNLNAAL